MKEKNICIQRQHLVLSVSRFQPSVPSAVFRHTEPGCLPGSLVIFSYKGQSQNNRKVANARASTPRNG